MVGETSERLQLSAELAVGLARRLWMTLGSEATDAGYCWDHFQNTFTDGFYVLWELGAALASTGENDDHGITWQQCVAYAEQHPSGDGFNRRWFKVLSASETRATIFSLGDISPALFEKLLTAYVGSACQFGPDGTQLSSGQAAFQPTAEFAREVKLLDLRCYNSMVAVTIKPG